MDELGRRVEEIDRKIDALRDALLTLTTALEALVERESEKEFLAELRQAFRKECGRVEEISPKNCQLRKFCFGRVNKAASKVIRIYAEKGAEEALDEVERHKRALKQHLNSAICPDKSCMEGMAEIFETIERLIRRSVELSKQRRTVLRQLGSVDEIDEEEMARILSPLSNPTRIKIMKLLAKGSKSYVELERAVGIRGGHLQFHLRSLMEAGYVIQERVRKKYAITQLGLTLLSQLAAIKEVLSLKEVN